MVENKNDWLHFLASCSCGSAVVCTYFILKNWLEDEIEKVASEFAESIKDARDKVCDDATEECISSIRKDLKDDVEKYLTHTREKLKADVDVVLGSVRKVLEADIENNKRGNQSDIDALIDSINECLADINKMLKYDI